MLDLGALEEAQAAVDLVRDVRIEERALHHPALRVAAVEQRDLVARRAVAVQRLRFLDEPLRLGEVGRRLVDAHRLARPGLGAQVLAEAARVARDELVGGVEDVAVRAVVALELDDRADAVLALELRHVADLRAAKGVDALVVVADAEERAAVLGRAGEHLEPRVLQAVGVLELVDQDVAEAPLVVLAQRLVVAQQLVGAQHQLGEVDHAFALALLVVGLVDLDQDAALLVLDLDVLGAQAVVLGAGDEPGQLLRRDSAPRRGSSP